MVAHLRVELGEGPAQLLQHVAHQTADLAQRMPGGNRNSGDTYQNSCVWPRNIPRIAALRIEEAGAEGGWVI